MGQKCWVKVTYNAPTEPNLNILKNKCVCNSSNSTIDFQENGFIVFPNPVIDFLNMSCCGINNPYIFNSVLATEQPYGYENSDLKNIYLSKQQLNASKKIPQFNI